MQVSVGGNNMFENFFKKKNKKHNEENDKKIIYIGDDIVSKEYEIKDLYVTYPSLISEKDGGIFYNYEEEQLEEIVVLKKDEFFVENVINGRIYGIFQKFTFETIKKFLNQYMVNELIPLELCLDNFVKTTITTGEILKYLYPDLMFVKSTSGYKDVVLQKISEVNKKIKESVLTKEEKDEFSLSLIELANHYVDTLKKISSSNDTSLGLQINRKSILTLKQECMQKLVEIEMMIPNENINFLTDELLELEKEIKGK